MRELRLALDRRGLHMAVFLQSLRRRDDAIFTLAIDGGPWATGQWPAGSGIETSFEGPERFVTAWGSGARFDSLRGRRRLRAAANLRANAIEVTVPRRLLGRLARRTRSADRW